MTIYAVSHAPEGDRLHCYEGQSEETVKALLKEGGFPFDLISQKDYEKRLAKAQDQPPDYKTLRARAYPSIGDQLDALWKGGQAAADMKEMIDCVKEQHPKP